MDEGTNDTLKKDTFAQSLGKHAAGTAILTAVGAAGGAIYGTVKKTNIANSTTVGGGIALLSSIGFGKVVYNMVTGADKDKPKSHANRLEAERASNKERQR